MARLHIWHGSGTKGITLVRTERSPYTRMVTVQLTADEEELLRDHFLAELGLMRVEKHDRMMARERSSWIQGMAGRLEAERKTG